MIKVRRYKDKVHGLEAVSLNRSMAWALIRNKCHELKLKVPQIYQIVEIEKND